ncbi:MAG: phosphatase PAP2 family protein [Calditrichaeota bacterium]|nr:MAG: phosphatase PAP2 family protein [Calditrichota bacterium]
MKPRFWVIFVICFAVGHALAESPYEPISMKDWSLLGASAVIGAFSHYWGEQIQPLQPYEIADLDHQEINRWDQPATHYYSQTAGELSDWGLKTCILLPSLFVVDSRMRQNGPKLAMMYLETMAAVGVVTEIAKVGIQRIRPYAYNPAVPTTAKLAKDTKKSFFSGHTSASFAGAVFFSKVFSDYYPESKWKSVVWAASLTVASSVGYNRIRAGKHYPSDVAVAAVVGSFLGYFIPQFHKNRKNVEPLTISPCCISLSFAF